MLGAQVVHNLSPEEKKSLLQLLGCRARSFGEKFLGLPAWINPKDPSTS